MFFKVIALDIDGTLTNSDKVITPKTKEMLMNYQEIGGALLTAERMKLFSAVPCQESISLRYAG